ncbi:amidoligase family protein [uncultured Oscillibacter sp.]|uniref:amidoligase family protein n=1 Tax=uncultured Oscillibacter sp. TaxID=876091 RepID=UPI002609E852|nr:amidoligase family protein [uncultured Oscillibacter sp.]
MIGMKEQCFGVEIEMTGVTREEAAQALADYFRTTPRYYGHTYDSWTVQDPAGKKWKLMSDASIHPECQGEDGYLRLDKDSAEGYPYKVEMVTPKLTYDELPRLQECMRRVKAIGAKVNGSCGLHVHVDASNHNRQSLKNLIGIMYSKEDILFKALQVNEARAARWCKKVREPMLKKARLLSADETQDLTLLEKVWYEGEVDKTDHYNWTRYYALNLHSVFYRGTVEWRCFNSTLDPVQAAAYVNLCLAISAQAIAQRSTIMQKTHSDNELFTFRVWLVRLGLNGSEFKATRDCLLSHLSGDRAWRRDKDSYEVNRRKKKHRENER